MKQYKISDSKEMVQLVYRSLQGKTLTEVGRRSHFLNIPRCPYEAGARDYVTRFWNGCTDKDSAKATIKDQKAKS